MAVKRISRCFDDFIEMCEDGRLFDVQRWIGDENPVVRPDGETRKRGERSPLRIAVELGFHSLVEVLAKAGAPQVDGYWNALDHAVETKRLDLAELLLEHGGSVADVSMRYVLHTWYLEMVELFLSHGASLIQDKPIAWGLIHKVRPVLGLLKRLAPTRPELMEQADLALRVHARDGNAKWVSLMLWVGADPWARGPEDIDEEVPEDAVDEDYSNAMEILVSRGQIEVLKRKKQLVTPDPARPEAARLLESACYAPDGQVLSLLVERGHRPRDLPDLGTSAIAGLVNSMRLDFHFFRPSPWANAALGPSCAREHLRMLHILVAHGAKWLPAHKGGIGDLRRSMLKLGPPYILEFLWLMQHYRAARRGDARDLLRTPAMTRHLGDERENAEQLAAKIPEAL